MAHQALIDLQNISLKAGERADYTQGGGGNTSAKLDDRLMAVKASGFQLKQITTETGFVVVDYAKIKEFYDAVDLSSGIDYEKEYTKTANDSIVDYEDLPRLRPSVEAGFHSILKKFVIHTHSVYANVLTCAVGGKEKMEEVLKESPYKYFWVEYIDPGFSLTLQIAKQIGELGAIPDVIFMENHGFIITADDANECVRIHDDVNERIIKALGITNVFPKVAVKACEDGTFASATDYIANYIRENKVTAQMFDDIILYPDQLVYLNGGADKMTIHTETGAITYTGTEKEALTVEETLAAYLYVIDTIKRCGMEVHTMGEAGVAFINNWESEKYRKSMAK